jgi:integrase
VTIAERGQRITELEGAAATAAQKVRAEYEVRYESKLALSEEEVQTKIDAITAPLNTQIAALSKQRDEAINELDDVRKKQAAAIEAAADKAVVEAQALKKPPPPFDTRLPLKAIAARQAIAHCVAEIELSPAQFIETAIRLQERPDLARELLGQMATTIRQLTPWFEKFIELYELEINRESALNGARGFKRVLVARKGRRSGKPISSASAHHVLWALKEFFSWLHCQPSYRRRINLSDVAYLSLTANEERAAHTGRPKSYASLDQYRAALFAMPTDTEAARRDQALFALLLLTAMRDTAAVSLKLKHISIERSYVFQDPREVRTKFAKAINTFFCPVGEDVAAIVRDWVDYLTTKKLFGPDDPLFPKTAIRQDEHRNFTAQGLTREHWANASSVREIVRAAFARVGLPYVKPHSVRDTLTQLAYKLELRPEELKAWSQNMGHESLLTTLGSYGPVSIERQAEIMSSVGQSDIAAGDIETRIAEKVAAILKGEEPRQEGLPRSGRVQGTDPEHGSQRRDDDVRPLWLDLARAAGAHHPVAGQFGRAKG